jgi:hypothetical protein
MNDPDVSFVREIIQRHQAFYEVSPHYIMVEDGRAASARRIQAGFDVAIYGLESLAEPVRSSDYGSGCAALRELAEKLMGQCTDSCSIEVVPFNSSLILDTQQNLQPQGMMRLRITHARGLDQPCGGEGAEGRPRGVPGSRHQLR